jgi:ribose 5-phosphate isomerase B
VIAIGSDKSGFALKESIKSFLKQEGFAFDDLGTQSMDAGVPYFEVASKIAPLVADGTYEKAILVCGTGMGMSVVANKHKGVYAAAVESVYSAKMARAINNAQILCMGGWIIATEMGIEMTKVFLNTEFLQGLEDWRQQFLTNAAQKLKDIEEDIYG